MQLILIEDIPKLGNAGDVVKVKDGYARNYLIPRGKAQLATEGRVKEFEHQKRVIEEKVKKEVAALQGRAAEFSGIALDFEMQSNEEGKLFGSVTSADIAARLAERGVEVDRRKIELGEPIKQVGQHPIAIRLHREVQVEIQVTVTSVGGAPEPEAEKPSAAELAMDEAEAMAQAEEHGPE